MKTKIKSHGDEVTAFYDKKVPKVGSNHTCLAVIALNSALKKDDNYYPQVFLKECKYIEKKVVGHIHDNLSGFFLLVSLRKNKLEQVKFFCKPIATSPYNDWRLFCYSKLTKFDYCQKEDIFCSFKQTIATGL